MDTRITLSESHEETVQRLARKAKTEGVKLFRDPTDGRYYASSVSQPEALHYLTALSCDCAGFAHYGHCKHNSALLVALGWIPGPDDDPEPTPPTALGGTIVRCESCRGLGEVHYETFDSRGRILGDWTTCPSCRGCGVERAAAA